MSKMSEKLVAAFAVVFCATISIAGVIDVIGDIHDKVWTTTDGGSWWGQATANVGTENTAGETIMWSIPFLLPALPVGESITDVNLALYCSGVSNIDTDGGEPNADKAMDIWGIRTAVASTEMNTDNDVANVINDGQYTYASTTFTAGDTYNFSSAGMANYLQSIYDNDANAAGKYVFLGVAPDAPMSAVSRYIAFNSANNAADKPVLSITTAIPEPATIGMLGLGAVVALLVRRLKI